MMNLCREHVCGDWAGDNSFIPHFKVSLWLQNNNSGIMSIILYTQFKYLHSTDTFRRMKMARVHWKMGTINFVSIQGNLSQWNSIITWHRARKCVFHLKVTHLHLAAMSLDRSHLSFVYSLPLYYNEWRDHRWNDTTHRIFLDRCRK